MTDPRIDQIEAWCKEIEDDPTLDARGRTEFTAGYIAAVHEAATQIRALIGVRP